MSKPETKKGKTVSTDGTLSINGTHSKAVATEIINLSINEKELDIAVNAYNTILNNPDLFNSILEEAKEANPDYDVYDTLAQESIKIAKSLTKYLA